MSRRKLINLIFNLATVVITMVGLFIVNSSIHNYDYVKYFTIVTNSLILIVSLIGAGYNIEYFFKRNKYEHFGNFVYVLKLTTSVCSLITFLTVVCFLQWQENMVHGPINVIMHYISPLLFIFTFIFFDNDRKYSFFASFFGIIVLVIYSLYAIPLSNINQNIWGGAPYIFLNLGVIKWWAILILPLFLIGGLAISLGLWLANRISFHIFTGVEVKNVEEITPEEKEIDAHIEVTPEDEKAIANALIEAKRGPRVYHISRRDDKKWQVKFANGQRAVKLFDTQAEAIVFAKRLAKTQGGSIRIHSLTGKIRK